MSSIEWRSVIGVVSIVNGFGVEAGAALATNPRMRKGAFTDRAVALTAQLIDAHGEVLFEQCGGCCEGTAPLCLRKDKFYVGSRELLLGTVDIVGP